MKTCINKNKKQYCHTRAIYSLALLPLLCGNPSNATEISLYDLTLEELINIKVNVASVKTETIPETPAIVSRYNLDDVQRMGINRLEDLLTLIPGVVVKQGLTGYPVVIMRGITHFTNQKILFLLDDVPYWDSKNGNFPIRGIPIEAISHVEVIRGPGAIYYGTNATTGVIKVTTKEGSNNIATLGIGSNGLRHSSAYVEHEFAEDIRLHFSYEARREDGYNGELNNLLVFDQFRFLAEDLLGEPTIPTSGTISIKDEKDAYWLKLQIHNFHLNAHYFENNYAQIDGILAPFNHSHTKYKGGLFHLDYRWQSDKLTTRFFTDYSHFEDKGQALHALGQNITFFGGGSSGTAIFEELDPADAFRWRGASNVNYEVNTKLSVFGGVEYERRSAADSLVRVQGMPTAASDFLATIGLPDLATEPFSIEDHGKVTEKSLYAQVDYRVDRWRFLLGARHTDNSSWDSTTTPRLSTVLTLGDNQSIKLLHSVGFNTPSLGTSEVVQVGAAVANPSLETEEIKTTDLAYTYSDDQSLFVANLYYFETDGLVQNVFASSTPEDIDINLNLDVHRWGMELDYQYAQTNWMLFSNLSYHHQGNRSDHNEDIIYSTIADFTQQIGDFTAAVAPRYTGVIGGHYTVADKHILGTSWRYIGAMKGSDAVRLLNLNYSFQYNKQLELYAVITNSLDEKIIHPDDSIAPIELPGGDGRGWISGIKIHF